MRSLYVPLSPEALDALRRLAARTLRTQHQQAAILIIEGLRRHGQPVSGLETVEPRRSEATHGRR
jgi:hypothetical protein